MDKLCSCCNTLVNSDNAAILTLGGFGNAKYLCEECDSVLNTLTRGRDVQEIDGAIECICDRMRRANIDDTFTLKTVKDILNEAKSRRDSIENGEYDFTREEETDAQEDIPAELCETEEDRLAEEKEAAEAKKWDKIITIVSAVVFAAVIGYFAYRFISGYFL